MKKYFIIILTLLFFTTIISSGYVAKKDKNVAFVTAENSADGYATVYKPDNRDLVILQLTDIHLEYYLYAKESIWNKYGICGDNASTLAMIDSILSATNPDIVVITGDALRSWNYDNLELYAKLAKVFEEHKVLWMPVFGNHEFEYMFATYHYTREELISELAKYPHCLISRGDCDDGEANYFVNIKNSDGNIIYTLCSMDCVFDESYLDGDIADGWSYVKTDAQIAWYEKHIKAISALQYGSNSNEVVPSMVFMHTPVPEVLTAWNEAWNDGHPNDKYFYGNLLNGSSTFRNHLGEDKFFDKAVELGSTKAIFFGHYHDNDFSVIYQGIRLTAGQMTTNNMDYRIGSTLEGLSYTEFDITRLSTYGDNRGATQINISSESSFTITPKYAREICEDYENYTVDFDALEEQLLQRGINIVR